MHPPREDPFQLGAWFCLPQVTAGEMDVVGMDLGSGALGPYDLIFPCPAAQLGCVLVSVCGRKLGLNVPRVSRSVHP